MQVNTDAVTLSRLAWEALNALPAGVCKKCWEVEFYLAAFGEEWQTYTLKAPDGFYLVDVDAGIKKAAGRVDAILSRRLLERTLTVNMREGEHVFCLAKRHKDALKRPGLVLRFDDDSLVVCDGAHRAEIYYSCDTPFPVSVLSGDELAEVLVTRPPQTERDGAEYLFGKLVAGLKAHPEAGEVMLTRCARVLGGARVAELLDVTLPENFGEVRISG